MALVAKIILGVAMTLVNFVLLPINLTLEASLPGLTDALNHVNDMLAYLVPFTKWVISWLPFSQNFYGFCILCLIFIYTMPLAFNLIKVVVKWWHYLIP